MDAATNFRVPTERGERQMQRTAATRTLVLTSAAIAAFVSPLTEMPIPILGQTGLLVACAFFCLVGGWMIGGRGALVVTVALAVASYWLVLVAVASSAQTANSATSLSQFSVLIVTVVAMIVVAGVTVLVTGQAWTVLLAFTAGCAVLAGSVWVLPDQINGRYFGLAGHPVEVGGTLAVGAVIAIFAPVKTPHVRIVFLALASLMLSAILRAEAATGLVAWLVAVAVGAVVARRFLLIVWMAIVAAAGVWVMSLSTVGLRLLSKVVEQFGALPLDYGAVAYDSANTLASRIATITLGFERFLESPLVGHGLTNEATIVLGNLHPHNVFVYAAVAGGALLVAPYLLLLLSGVSGATSIARRRVTFRGDVAMVASASAAWIGALSGPQLYQRPWLLPVLLIAFVTLLRPERVVAPHS
ncbi:hypothetical protein [Microbacterium gallinarum]|uniref:O-antigen ligase domain-containing protein n=1 Tax=Microbacterium gallinarum TaxID=2762209 RepID=A0ABR8X367_9MICO|nr:hypothetical protein [Microbacterium gallinarum]MBD8023738.1 hypothetical protein [Microbacterium gallinarum]